MNKKHFVTVEILQCHVVSMLLRQVMRHESHLLFITHANRDSSMAAAACCCFKAYPG